MAPKKKLRTKPPKKKKAAGDAAMSKIRAKRGLPAEVARACGVSRQAIDFWDRVPAEHVMTVSPLIGLRPEAIRPDVFKGR